MEYRHLKSSDLKSQNSELHFYFPLEEDLNQAESIISQLKEDKKKLKEALRTVITERNKNKEKLNKIRAKYSQLKLYLKQECDFIESVKKDYKEISKSRNKHSQFSVSIEEINTIFELLKTYTKTCKVSLTLDETFIDSLKDSVKYEKYDEFVAKVLKYSVKSAKKQQEFNEEDTPQFNKQTSDLKIDQFLENSKRLVEGLSKQQEKLKKINNDYRSQKSPSKKHMKTLSNVPSSFKLFPSESLSRKIRSSMSSISPIAERKSIDKEFKTPPFKNRLMKYA